MRFEHLTFSSSDRLPLFDVADAGLRVARVLGRLLPGRVAVWHEVGDHLHLVVRADGQTRGRNRQRLVLGLRAAGARVGSSYARRIEDRAHLLNGIRYVLRQADHHGSRDATAALTTSSSFPDLVGARVLRGLDTHALDAALPRVHADEWWAALGLDPVAPLDADAIVRAGWPRLLRAARRAAGCLPEDPALAPPCCAARAAFASLASRTGASAQQIAETLGIHPRSARRLVQRGAPDRLLRAAALQLALEATTPSAAPTPPSPGHLSAYSHPEGRPLP